MYYSNILLSIWITNRAGARMLTINPAILPSLRDISHADVPCPRTAQTTNRVADGSPARKARQSFSLSHDNATLSFAQSTLVAGKCQHIHRQGRPCARFPRKRIAVSIFCAQRGHVLPFACFLCAWAQSMRSISRRCRR